MKILLKNITKSFGTNQVIRPTDLTIEDGSFTTLLGPSGCGKTTLLRMISGLETPDSGEIYFDEQCMFSAEKKINIPPEKRGLGFVFQDFALWPHMTVFENVAFGLRSRGEKKEIREKVEKALQAVRLSGFEDRYPGQLSGGQQQRVAFARAIVIEPECILFDEPLSALDALLREEMRVEIKNLMKNLGITSVFVTHDQTEAMSMSDRVALLNKGLVEQCDTPETVYHKPRTEFVAKFLGKSNWIDEDTMFRPEDALIIEETQMRSEIGQQDTSALRHFDVTVADTHYMGNLYELIMYYHNDVKWVLYSPVRAEAGQKLTLYIRNEKMIRFEGKKGL